MAARVLADHFIPGGKAPRAPFKLTPMPTLRSRRGLVELTVVANFVEVFLAKEGHEGPVGINYLEKIQLPTLPSVYGAMLAGVDYILMGAGIPRWWDQLADRYVVAWWTVPFTSGSSGPSSASRSGSRTRLVPSRTSGPSITTTSTITFPTNRPWTARRRRFSCGWRMSRKFRKRANDRDGQGAQSINPQLQ